MVTPPGLGVSGVGVGGEPIRGVEGEAIGGVGEEELPDEGMVGGATVTGLL